MQSCKFKGGHHFNIQTYEWDRYCVMPLLTIRTMGQDVPFASPQTASCWDSGQCTDGQSHYPEES